MLVKKPKDNATYYKGETIPVEFTCTDTGEYDTIYVSAYLYKGDFETKTIVADAPSDFQLADGMIVFKNTIKTSGVAAGKYSLYIKAGGPLAEEFIDDASMDITINTLKAPTKLKAKAGKKKVTITYKKATGATSYEIYRSTKKSKNYKKVKTTTKLKYVDKKVKKGKKYYYKVRAKRSAGNGTVYSSYRGPIKTKKVKR